MTKDFVNTSKILESTKVTFIREKTKIRASNN